MEIPATEDGASHCPRRFARLFILGLITSLIAVSLLDVVLSGKRGCGPCTAVRVVIPLGVFGFGVYGALLLSLILSNSTYLVSVAAPMCAGAHAYLVGVLLYHNEICRLCIVAA